jgi:hypothetical protein
MLYINLECPLPVEQDYHMSYVCSIDPYFIALMCSSEVCWVTVDPSLSSLDTALINNEILLLIFQLKVFFFYAIEVK